MAVRQEDKPVAGSHTNKENESISWRFGVYWTLDVEQSHARNDGTDKIDVEDGKYINKMEDDRNGHEAEAIEAGHDGVCISQAG